ncbi:glycosyltransferase family 2 protein [Cellulosilyticum sp. I15G10I2]|uniref:glycosyltransferase family 2 protein n=1 Tax=Cellulosilyticum sp. I15G10I2 TaxID=1892843 RepID=UPI00085C4BEF|nr:glycosyltransferase family 2 protein [Cellulosilyticum sp. I15G10I2]
MKKISVVIPMYSEEAMVMPCYEKLSLIMHDITLYAYELIFVNDGSTDNTLPLLEALCLKDNHVKVISLSRNFGHQAAVTCGITYAIGDAIIIIDADLQDPPELICNMITFWESGYDVVYGRRQKRSGETLFKRLSAKIFYRFLNYLSDINIPLDTGDFRLIDKKVALILIHLPEHNRFLRGLIPWCGFKQIPLAYERQPRFAGKTKYPFKKMIQFAIDGIIAFSSKPLRLIMKLGIFAVMIALLIFLYYFTALISPHIIVIPDFAWLIIIISFFGGVQLVAIGVLGEYIGRMYDESKNRPLYIVDKTFNTSPKKTF